jgi:hypothetical protein
MDSEFGTRLNDEPVPADPWVVTQQAKYDDASGCRSQIILRRRLSLMSVGSESLGGGTRRATPAGVALTIFFDEYPSAPGKEFANLDDRCQGVGSSRAESNLVLLLSHWCATENFIPRYRFCHVVE